MAILERLVSGFYIDGECEVFCRYNDVTDKLQEVIIRGLIDREVDVLINDELLERGRNTPNETIFNVRPMDVTYFVAVEPDETPNDTPRIVCTYYARKLTRSDIARDR